MPKMDRASDDALIVFTPSGRRGRFPVGTGVLDAARGLGVDIDSVCGGRGLCGHCQIAVSAGAFPKFGLTSAAEHLSPKGDVETTFADRNGLAPERRLACVAAALADVVIDVPQESQVHKQVVRKRAEARAIDIDPVMRLHFVTLKPPRLDDQASDRARLENALAADWGLTDLDWDLSALHALSAALREDNWQATVLVRNSRQVVGVLPGLRDRLFGLAIDVGTTTIAVHLCDLASGSVEAAIGAMNPQIRFGEDVMSRISFVQLNPDQAAAPTSIVRDAINQLAKQAATAAGVTPADIVEATFVGNPTMHHLLLGLNPLQLGSVPFPLVTDSAVTVSAHALDLDLHPGARCYVLPCIAGHVGADTAGVILSEAPHQSDALMLTVDIGTNAEIVLGDKRGLVACSCPTGPAFEGAQISCGQRAAPGAIERVRIDRDTLVPRFKVIGCDLWSDDPAFAEAVATLGVTGICGSGIVEAVAEMVLAGIVAPSGLVDGRGRQDHPHIVPTGRSFAYRLHDGPPAMLITQHDVRAIQLAKAALQASIRLLMEQIGATVVDRIVLTGAFGTYIDPFHAMVLGMIPECDPTRVDAAGNAAGTGARIALLNRAARGEIETLARAVEKVETAAAPQFQDYFVAAMAFAPTVVAVERDNAGAESPAPASMRT